jgi:pimeloyl-ACP methyl ester carboxylesterase
MSAEKSTNGACNMRIALPFLLATGLLTAGPLRSQTNDTSRVRTAFDAVSRLRNDYERQHGHFLLVNGIRMHYLEWGDKNGVPLVWAHGSASSGLELRAVAPRLAAAGYRVLAVDYRGHGLTRVRDYDFGIYHIADDLIGLLDSLKISKAVFGGASKGGSVATAVYDQYPNRVLGLLMADGGTYSMQWMWDRQSPEQRRRSLTDPIPHITGPSEFDVFRQVAGDIPPGELPMERLLNLLLHIGPEENGKWAFLPGFDRMIFVDEVEGITHPSTFPPLTWSEASLIPRMVFRRLHVPMMILDPQRENDPRPVTDQNERLAKDHPDLVTHRIYPQTDHNILQSKPDWLVRDAVELLDQVRKRQ